MVTQAVERGCTIGEKDGKKMETEQKVNDATASLAKLLEMQKKKDFFPFTKNSRKKIMSLGTP